jgi:hypothetical protein
VTVVAPLLDFTDLPGGERVRRGLADLAAHRDTLEALWLQMASSRMREHQLPVPTGPADVHIALFTRCVEADPASGHATYRALNEELSSFLDALEDRRRRIRRAAHTP